MYVATVLGLMLLHILNKKLFQRLEPYQQYIKKSNLLQIRFVLFWGIYLRNSIWVE